jgi:hypothetical protein
VVTGVALTEALAAATAAANAAKSAADAARNAALAADDAADRAAAILARLESRAQSAAQAAWSAPPSSQQLEPAEVPERLLPRRIFIIRHGESQARAAPRPARAGCRVRSLHPLHPALCTLHVACARHCKC